MSDEEPTKIPSLMPAAPVHTRPPAPAVPAAPAAPTFDDDESGPPDLDLAIDDAPRRAPAPPLAFSGAEGGLEDEDAAESLAIELDQPTSGTLRDASLAPARVASRAPGVPADAASPDPTPSEVDAARVAEVARYGAPPRSLLEAPGYAIRTHLRRRALRADLELVRAAQIRGEREANARLAQITLAMRPSVDRAHPLFAMFEGLSSYDALADARSGAQEQTERQEAEMAARRQAEMAGATADRQTLEQALAEAEAALAREAEGRARAEAKLRRVEIELRAAHDAARIAAGPGAKYAPPEHAARIKELEATRSERAAELSPWVSREASAVAVVREKSAAVRDLKRRIAQAEGLVRAQERAGQSALSAISKAVQDAEEKRLAAYADAAREIGRARGHELSASDRDLITQVETDVRAARLRTDLHELALLPIHAEAERRGRILLAVLVAAIALLLFMVLRTALH